VFLSCCCVVTSEAGSAFGRGDAEACVRNDCQRAEQREAPLDVRRHDYSTQGGKGAKAIKRTCLFDLTFCCSGHQGRPKRGVSVDQRRESVRLERKQSNRNVSKVLFVCFQVLLKRCFLCSGLCTRRWDKWTWQKRFENNSSMKCIL
jgi:hypothetical protein